MTFASNLRFRHIPYANRLVAPAQTDLVLLLVLVAMALVLGGCGAGTSDSVSSSIDIEAAPIAAPVETLDTQLSKALEDEGLSGDAAFNRTLPLITDPMAQLGKKLFFSKSLGGDMDVACVSCHHPNLGGADGLSLAVGIEANNSDLLGPGRAHAATGLSNVPRNSPTVFNSGLWDKSMFWDSRVESFAGLEFANGAASDIRTPDVAFGNADTDAGTTIPAAQALFPVTSVEEMRGHRFEEAKDNNAVRKRLAERLGGYGSAAAELTKNNWLTEFQMAFGPGTAEDLVTFANIAQAIGEYERSMVFTKNPFSRYLSGDADALSNQQKRGAILFYTDESEGGGGCSNCHAGDRFTDEDHHIVAFPQFGPGKGDANEDDFGRERETGDIDDRYRFRTPSLLNIEVTAPYGHAGAYSTLAEVVAHYDDPAAAVNQFFEDDAACGLSQFADLVQCANLFPASELNSDEALKALDDARAVDNAEFTEVTLDDEQRASIEAFLLALTDPCVKDADCLAPWIADPSTTGPDGLQLNAVNFQGEPL